MKAGSDGPDHQIRSAVRYILASGVKSVSTAHVEFDENSPARFDLVLYRTTQRPLFACVATDRPCISHFYSTPLDADISLSSTDPVSAILQTSTLQL